MSQSQSQYSNFVPSLYNRNTETLGYLTLLRNTTTSSGSQNQYLIDTLEPYSKPDFLCLVDPPLIPDSLLCDLNRSSDVWQEYNQVALIKNGIPKVICKRCGTILEHLMNSLLIKKGYQGTSTIKKYLGTTNCIQAGQGKGGLGISRFLKTKEEELLQFTTINRLPIQLFEAPKLSKIIRIARSAPSEPLIPSAKTIRRRLHSIQSALRTLPPNTKLLLTLNCWTSPYNQAFIAITAYFIYQEVLLRFKLVHGVHSGSNLSQITEQYSAAAKKNTQNYSITATLNKIRYLAIYVNASPQRRKTFLQLQPKEPRLVPVQDVKTR
ncbi:hypothetical protein N7509_011480 [Penicillium cosmopolitanum]|uniref:Uncharacterized protein n=1 Tax=Penicillium cosmopolitanum TaxID=1131564 RepID=A0A9W9SGV3_9EURO|nr:uncharacterized protein N7509_011480 [Penicillium cosmopolitanum]KAJ5378361.1 hypothetical protein N7509_011480 [Penicillium cosmopolitanum]